MDNPRAMQTNAADSAPGVDDGPAGTVRPPSVNSKPGGRHLVWIGVLVLLAIVIGSFFAKPLRNDRTPMVTQGATKGEIAASTVPGTADRQEANRPVGDQQGR
jgi:hypothetical protein